MSLSEEKFKQGMALLTATFPAWTFTIRVYWEMLNDLSDEEFETSIIRFIKTHPEIYPNTNVIAIIRRGALEERYPSVGEAWRNACEVLQKGYEKVAWIHPIVKEVASMVGTYEIRTTENPEITRAHFMKFYDDRIRVAKEDSVKQIAAPERKQIA